eukprot:TRINITY_DN2113_c1_g2_i1.p1 TRINITY_DN2113_c1_g2~~TRINITY_DN2113_c1_g2_i1.p1  ORF type:complete len:206 (-),score=7.46 TRINITY_DN2113_c1_g2_i1:397-1014(-)
MPSLGPGLWMKLVGLGVVTPRSSQCLQLTYRCQSYSQSLVEGADMHKWDITHVDANRADESVHRVIQNYKRSSDDCLERFWNTKDTFGSESTFCFRPTRVSNCYCIGVDVEMDGQEQFVAKAVKYLECRVYAQHLSPGKDMIKSSIVKLNHGDATLPPVITYFKMRWFQNMAHDDVYAEWFQNIKDDPSMETICFRHEGKRRQLI